MGINYKFSSSNDIKRKKKDFLELIQKTNNDVLFHENGENGGTQMILRMETWREGECTGVDELWKFLFFRPREPQ